MTDVLTTGEALIAGKVSRSGLSGNLPLSMGGAELNVAVALAAAGRDVCLATRVGDDPFGELLQTLLGRTSVNVVLETDPHARTGFYLRTERINGRQVSYYRTGSAGARLVESATLAEHLRTARVLHVTGITAALDPANPDALEALMQSARRHGCRVSFDVNFRSALWSADQAAPVLRRLASAADLVFVGADEALDLWNTSDPSLIARTVGAEEVVVKDGDNLRVHVVDHSQVQSFTVSPVSVVDAVGAGDAFAAGYLHACLDDATTSVRVAVAHAMAAEILQLTEDALDTAAVDRALTSRL